MLMNNSLQKCVVLLLEPGSLMLVNTNNNISNSQIALCYGYGFKDSQ